MTLKLDPRNVGVNLIFCETKFEFKDDRMYRPLLMESSQKILAELILEHDSCL